MFLIINISILAVFSSVLIDKLAILPNNLFWQYLLVLGTNKLAILAVFSSVLMDKLEILAVLSSVPNW